MCFPPWFPLLSRCFALPHYSGMVHYLFILLFHSFQCTMPRQTAPQHDNDSNDVPSLLIIGAGYAGLTLAQELSSSSSSYRFDVVDRLHPPNSSGVVNGTLRSPFAKKWFQQRLHRRECDPNALVDLRHVLQDDDRVPEQALLTLLRYNIPVHYRHCVTKITQKSYRWYVELQIDSDDDDDDVMSTTWGPYDWMVVADGTRSAFRRQSTLHKNHQLLVIGDAQGQPWWDLGLTRLQRGADTAMRHGHQVARALLALRQQNNDTTEECRQILDQFRPHARWRHPLVCGMLVVLLPVTMVLFSSVLPMTPLSFPETHVSVEL